MLKRVEKGSSFSLLICIIMGAFNYLLKRANSGCYLPSWHVRERGGEGFQVSHSLFVDDNLVFCEVHNIKDLSELQLVWFEVISRLRVNLDKNELIPIGTVKFCDDLTLELGVR